MMLLESLLGQALPGLSLGEQASTKVLNLECDSRNVRPGSLFFAIRGVKLDGTAFAAEAAAKGACAVVADRPLVLPAGTPLVLVEDARRAMALCADVFYGFPSKRLKVIGITGTNGKTTSSYLIEHLLTSQGKRVGVFGTVNYRYPGVIVPALETTPGPLRLHAMLAEMAEAGCDAAVMEASSHALHQDRVGGIRFEAALFTNLTQDHLDYHGTLENYFESKARLFTSLSEDKVSILNGDDAWSRKLEPRVRSRRLTYGIEGPADVRAQALRWEQGNAVFDLTVTGRKTSVRLPMVGRHNVYNALGALATLEALGYDALGSSVMLKDFQGVPGRLESVKCGQDFSVFIDFAHTPDGLENVLSSLKPFQERKLLVVFGCGGDRDRGKRPQMGRIASHFADHVIVTADNPRSEDPKAIAEEIRSGFPDTFKAFSVVVDRRKAIRQALLAAKGGDIVLIAGKGHETTQVIGKEAMPFSDRAEVERVLNGY